VKKITLLFLAIVLLFNIAAKADEGMWLLTMLNKSYDDMKKQGLKLTPEQIYSINKASIKDAIVQFGRGCTAEIVSDQGLVLTNHHCGYGVIQQFSSVEHDYLKDGFWAKTHEDEIATPGLTVTFVQRIEDVSARINAALNDKMTSKERDEIIKKMSKEIESKAVPADDKFQEARVRPIFAGNQFLLFVYETYRDVRFVGAPPSSIGKFGGETDNWMWPRHTGDFSVFRVYMSKDGKPAEYAKDNVPLKPKYFLPVSIKGTKVGDFTMIMGFPGRTTRFMTSYEIDEVLKVVNPVRIKLRSIRQDIMVADMKTSDKIRIQYAAKYAGSANGWKKAIGEMKGLVTLNVREQKQKVENDFTTWVNADANRKAKYGDALSMIEKAVKSRSELGFVLSYFNEGISRGIELLNIAGETQDLYAQLAKVDAKDEEKKGEIDKVKKAAARFYKDYNLPTDKKIAAALLKVFAKDVNPKYFPTVFEDIKNQYGNDIDKFVDSLYAKSLFTDKAKLDAFLANPDKNTLENDIAFKTIKSISAKSKELMPEMMSINASYSDGVRLYIGGSLEMSGNKAMYPDANSTIRLTYGTVKNYKPRDGVLYEHYTTLKGYIEKEDSTNSEFVVPKKLKELYAKKDFGPYGQDGEMHTCFLSTNDITGGNSGSPIMNGKGELIGLAFDGNWESLSSDIAFDPDLQRTISVDIRYVLFIIDKYGNAKHLVDEMKIAK